LEPPTILRRNSNEETHERDLGLTLLTGTATVAFSQADTDKQKAAKKKKNASQHIKGNSQQVKGESPQISSVKGSTAKKGTDATDKKAQ
jgi:hypothetical protein